MSNNTPLAHVLKRLMHERGYSVERLADESRVNKKTLYHWLNGDVRKPQRWQELIAVACALGLKKAQASELLQSAEYPSVDELLPRVKEQDKALLLQWSVTPPNNLPAQMTNFIGRTTEIRRITELLAGAEPRLVTLTGPGGSGKTRLALQVANDLLDSFEHGVFFVDLASINNPNLITGAIAYALGVKEGPGEPLIERLKIYLGNKHLLLLLDNFEQVVTAGPQVTDLLKVAHQLKVLVTSRVVLHVYGEQEYSVPPLELPEPQATLASLAKNPAVALFVKRAQHAKERFVLTHENAAAVAKICTRLEGLPLAIELAAAHCRQFEPHDILERFQSRLEMANDGPVDVPRRHQTLRAMIGWSYDLLPKDQQTLFVRLAVFVGQYTVEAVTAVCAMAGDAPQETLNQLTFLRKSNLLWEEVGSDSKPRFGMLETIREYALERLVESGEIETLRQQHAAYYLALIEAAAPELRGSQAAVWVRRFEQEHDNLRAALQWALDRKQPEIALRFGAALSQFWHVRGYWSEGRQWLHRILTSSITVKSSIRAAALSGAALLAHNQNDYAQATAQYNESLVLYRQLGDKRCIADVTGSLGLVAQSERDYSQSAALYEVSLRMFRELGDKRDIGAALNRLAWTALFAGHLDQASLLGEESFLLWQELEDVQRSAEVANILGMIAFYKGDYLQAANFYRQALQHYSEISYTWGISALLMEQGFVALFQGDGVQAKSLFQESLALQRELQDKLVIAYCLDGLAGVGGVLKDPVRAARLGGAAEALRESLDIPLPPVERTHHERMVAATRAQLEEETWEAAWAEGRTMPLDQAIAYALEQAD